MTDAVVFEVSRGRLLLIGLVLGPLMTGAGVLILTAALNPAAVQWLAPASPLVWLLYLVIGGVGTAFFGFATVVGWLTLLRKPGAGLVVDADGFTDTSSGIAAGRTTWDQVTGWHLQHVQRQVNLCVMVQDPDSVLARMGPIKRLMSRGNVKLVGTPVCIGLTNLRGGPEPVLAAFEEYHGQWLSRNSGAGER
ncbi:STM3941 family protein [Promicromonospora sp. NPDC050249]|uniref:STM3941 family protein n=1 Tax=Promicromonospora sp. NPDC050249 TaxID=3154743 RepID=UPI00340E3EE4